MDMDMDAPKKLFVAREKNFVKRNILRVKRSYPAEPKQRFVDTRYGNTHDLKSSGLLPIYVHKKVRVYIMRVYKKNDFYFSFVLAFYAFSAVSLHIVQLFYLDFISILKATFFFRIMEKYRNSLRLIRKPT